MSVLELSELNPTPADAAQSAQCLLVPAPKGKTSIPELCLGSCCGVCCLCEFRDSLASGWLVPSALAVGLGGLLGVCRGGGPKGSVAAI